MVAAEEVKQVTEKLEETHIESAEENHDQATEDTGAGSETAAKKKKKNKKKKKGPKTQTEPPTVPVSKIYTNKVYPVGECHDYVNEYSY